MPFFASDASSIFSFLFFILKLSNFSSLISSKEATVKAKTNFQYHFCYYKSETSALFEFKVHVQEILILKLGVPCSKIVVSVGMAGKKIEI